MKAKVTAYALCALMCGTALAGWASRPTAKATDVGRAITLETAVPKSFGDWIVPVELSSQIVNPQVDEAVNKIYSQVLSRTYVNRDGYRIMLSLAYGDDQRGGLQAHRPEVCYPGNGFKLSKTEDGKLLTPYGSVEVRRLVTNLGSRHEPVTYWLTVGDQVVVGNVNKRIAEMRLALTGQVPDGMLFRISSIDTDSTRAFAMQQKFAADMMSAVPGDVRKHLSGLAVPPGAG